MLTDSQMDGQTNRGTNGWTENQKTILYLLLSASTINKTSNAQCGEKGPHAICTGKVQMSVCIHAV